MAIVIVFNLGLAKLWWTNRTTRKHEIIDEEKRTHLTEMRKTGISTRRRDEIPFGVRAIQRGIEVDGIWISRPASPSLEGRGKVASSLTLVGVDTISEEKGNEADDGNPYLPPLPNLDRTTSEGSIFQRLNGSEPLNSTPSTTAPVSQFASQIRRQAPPRVRPVLSEDTLRKLEAHGRSRPTPETYIPTSSLRNPRRPSQRSSASSSGGESVDSLPRSTSGRSASGRSYSSSRSSRLYTSRNLYESRLHFASVPTESPEKESSDPFETPARTPSGFSAFSQTRGESLGSHLEDQHLPAPEPTFSPGDIHVNRASRRVNAGFEILPAGTFGGLEEFRRSDSATDIESGEEPVVGTARPTSRLKKKSASQLPHETLPF